MGSVGENAFMECIKLDAAKLSGDIGDYAFYECSSLHHVELSPSVSRLGTGCFRRSGIVQADLPEGILAIEYTTFCECASLSSASIPSTVKSIGGSAF